MIRQICFQVRFFFNEIEAAPKTEVTTLAEVCGSWHLAPKLESEQK